jgi:hypothetical protein
MTSPYLHHPVPLTRTTHVGSVLRSLRKLAELDLEAVSRKVHVEPHAVACRETRDVMMSTALIEMADAVGYDVVLVPRIKPAGETSTTIRVIPPERRPQFNAQLEAWRAACDLANVYSNAAAYGMPVPTKRDQAWTAARSKWERTRTR